MLLLIFLCQPNIGQLAAGCSSKLRTCAVPQVTGALMDWLDLDRPVAGCIAATGQSSRSLDEPLADLPAECCSSAQADSESRTASCRLMLMLIDISRITSLDMHLVRERAATMRSRTTLRPILRARHRKQLHVTVRTVTHVTERSLACLTLGCGVVFADYPCGEAAGPSH
jgi:hypothetical protein